VPVRAVAAVVLRLHAGRLLLLMEFRTSHGRSAAVIITAAERPWLVRNSINNSNLPACSRSTTAATARTAVAGGRGNSIRR
jgi:hypothetical protein